jgi:hypothetical protein
LPWVRPGKRITTYDELRRWRDDLVALQPDRRLHSPARSTIAAELVSEDHRTGVARPRFDLQRHGAAFESLAGSLRAQLMKNHMQDLELVRSATQGTLTGHRLAETAKD